MSRTTKSLALALALLLGLPLAGLSALQHWIGSDDFRARVEREASDALGVPVKLERLDVDVWPLPALGVSGIRIQTRPALTLGNAWRCARPGAVCGHKGDWQLERCCCTA